MNNRRTKPECKVCGNGASETNDTIKECIYKARHFYLCERCGAEWHIKSDEEIINEFTEREAKLVEALKFYASRANHDLIYNGCTAMDRYRGKIALSVLKELEIEE